MRPSPWKTSEVVQRQKATAAQAPSEKRVLLVHGQTLGNDVPELWGHAAAPSLLLVTLSSSPSLFHAFQPIVP